MVTSTQIACTSGGGGGGGVGLPPTLTSFTMEPGSAAAGLTITFSGNFGFADPDGNLNGGSLNYTYEGTTYSLPLPAEFAGVTSGSASFTLDATLSSSTGVMDIPFWLVDSAGLSSNTIQGSFTQLWTRQFGTMLEDLGNGVACDSADNIVVTGTTFGNLNGETNLGVSDVFVTKYAADATMLWTKLIGSDNVDNGRGVAVDSNNNIYVTGDTAGTSFDGQVVAAPVAGFLAKYDTAGNRVWTHLLSSSTGTQAYDVATAAGNYLYVAGETQGNLDGEINSGGWDAFLVKYDSDGNRLWTRLLGTTGSETAYGVTADSSGNVYITGATDGVLAIDPSPDDPVVNYDAFVAKYNAAGVLQWVTQLGTSCSEWGNDIAIDVSGNSSIAGKIYTCAFAGNTPSGMYDAFVTQLDPAGATNWVRQFGTANHDSANSVATDSVGSIYVTGYLDSVYFNDDNEGDVIFLAKYASSGIREWLAQDSANYSWGNQGLSISLDSADKVFVTGTTHGYMDGYTNPNYGEDEVFILKYDTTGIRH